MPKGQRFPAGTTAPWQANDRMTVDDWLREQYTVKGRSASDIARELGCDRGTVVNALGCRGIPLHRPVRPQDGADLTALPGATLEQLKAAYLAAGSVRGAARSLHVSEGAYLRALWRLQYPEDPAVFAARVAAAAATPANPKRQSENPRKPIPKGWIGVARVAKARGVDAASVREVVYRCQRAEDATGVWPAGSIPRPDQRHVLAWDPTRKDVKAYLRGADRADARLRDKDWLRARYVDDGWTQAALARELKCTKGRVRQALAAARIPLKASTQTRALEHVTLEELRAALAEHRTMAAAAASLGVSHVPFRTELGLKEAEAAHAAEVVEVSG